MIYGVGVDLCQVARIETSIQRKGFCERVFSAPEQAFLQGHGEKARAESAAANFAAKEAFLKAAGTGLSGFSLVEISALRQENGQPYYQFAGKAEEWMHANGLCAKLSLSHEGGVACAFAVLEYLPATNKQAQNQEGTV